MTVTRSFARSLTHSLTPLHSTQIFSSVFTSLPVQLQSEICNHFVQALQRRSMSTVWNHVWTTIYSTTCSGAPQSKYQSFALPTDCEGNPLVSDGFSSQMVSNVESISMS